MSKIIPLAVVLLLFCGFKKNHKKVIQSNTNPFGALLFKYGPTDTVVLTANFIKTGEITEVNKNTLSMISKNTDENFKKINYAVGFTIPGNKQLFYAPSKDPNFLAILKSKGGVANKITISCVVYRFYSMDDTCKFFYIDKASIVD